MFGPFERLKNYLEWRRRPRGDKLPNGRISYKKAWKYELEFNQRSIKTMLCDDLHSYNDVQIWSDCHMGVWLMIFQNQNANARFFLNRGLSIADNVMAGKVPLYPPNRPHPASMARFLTAFAHGTAAAGRSDWPERFREASKATVEEVEAIAKEEEWYTDLDQKVLQAARQSMLGNDFETAKRLLHQYPCPLFERERTLFVTLLEAPSVPPPLSNPKLLAEFDAHFDIVRALYDEHKITGPEGYAINLNSTEAAFELSGIRDKYFFSPNGEIDWQRAIKEWAM